MASSSDFLDYGNVAGRQHFKLPATFFVAGRQHLMLPKCCRSVAGNICVALVCCRYVASTSSFTVVFSLRT